MPVYEHHKVDVEVTVRVDDHTLRFVENGQAAGARYHGRDPREHGFATSETLESRYQQAVGEALAVATGRAMQTMRRLYPMTGAAEVGELPGCPVCWLPIATAAGVLVRHENVRLGGQCEGSALPPGSITVPIK